MAYTISINEQQRAIIAAALAAYAQPGSPNFTGEDEDEAMYLNQAFAQLPQDEAATPGALHGLCL